MQSQKKNSWPSSKKGAELSPWAAARLQVDPGESGGRWFHGRDDDAHMDAGLSRNVQTMVWTCLNSISPFCSCVYMCVYYLNFKDLIHGDDVDLGTVAIGFEWFWFHVGEAFAVRGGWVVRWLLLPKRCSAGRVFGWESWLRFSGSPDTLYMNPDSLISSFKFFVFF